MPLLTVINNKSHTTMERKRFDTLTEDISEKDYHADRSLNYTTLARYEREGFQALAKEEEPATDAQTFGSAVDVLLTRPGSFDDEFMLIGSRDKVEKKAKEIVIELWKRFHDRFPRLQDIPKEDLLYVLNEYTWYTNWTEKTRLHKIADSDLWRSMYDTYGSDKTFIDDMTYAKAESCASALRRAESTQWLFFPDTQNIERYYQQKIIRDIGGMRFKGMLDEVVVFHNDRRIVPVDFKTMRNPAYMFPKSFVRWGYWIQAQLYTALLRDLVKDDPYYKDFTVDPFEFAVVSKADSSVLLWTYDEAPGSGTMTVQDKRGNAVVMRDYMTIAGEVSAHLAKSDGMPRGIDKNRSNDILLAIREAYCRD